MKKQTNPASIFLRLAAFNLLVVIVFVVFYFLYRNSGGEQPVYFLYAAAAALVSVIGSLFAYRHFKEKLEPPRGR